jgi:hypothetical protein
MKDKLSSALMKRVSMTGGSFKGAIPEDDKGAMNPASTKSMTHLMSRRREELEDKRKADADKDKEDKDRFEKQNRVSQSYLMNIDEKYCSSSTEGQDEGRLRQARGCDEGKEAANAQGRRGGQIEDLRRC